MSCVIPRANGEL